MARRVTRSSAKRARAGEETSRVLPELLSALVASEALDEVELASLRGTCKVARAKISPVDMLRSALSHGNLARALEISASVPGPEVANALGAYFRGDQRRLCCANCCGPLIRLCNSLPPRDDVTELPASVAAKVLVAGLLAGEEEMVAVIDHHEKLASMHSMDMLGVAITGLTRMTPKAFRKPRFSTLKSDVLALVIIHILTLRGWTFPPEEHEVEETFARVVFNTRCPSLWILTEKIMGAGKQRYVDELRARVRASRAGRMTVVDRVLLSHV